MILLEVAVTLPLEQTLTYKASPLLFGGGEEVEGARVIGRRVLVPLGNRRVTGYVLGHAGDRAGGEAGDGHRLKEVLECLDDRPLFPAHLVAFYRWAAEYYQYPLGLVLKSALPAGLSGSSRKRLVWKGDCQALARLGVAESPRWLVELAAKGRLGYQASKGLLASSREHRLLQTLVAGQLVEILEDRPRDVVGQRFQLSYSLLGQGRAVAQLLAHADDQAPPPPPADLAKAARRHGHVLTVSELRLLTVLASADVAEGAMTSAQLREKSGVAATAKGLAGLVAKGLIEEHRQRLYRSPFGAPLPFYPPPLELSQGQQQVLAEILPGLGQDRFLSFLLHGVTGCGKTEVYLRAAEETLRQDREVLVLVPEIALATQLESHFLSRFGEQVVLLHSGLSGAERYDQYSLALEGRARIVIGARSAVFAPLARLGLIIVDEEHDAGFKQDEGFCYHGRDLAVLRASLQRCTVILGSATPSLASYSNGLSGKYRLLTMLERVCDRQLPAVSVVDLGGKAHQEKPGIISDPLLERLRHTLARGKQTILLINRRGFAGAAICRDCGTPVQCHHCHVSLTLHKGRNRLVCHYCGFTIAAATVCGSCRGSDLAPAGFGTERVEEEVRQLLPEARLARLDSDSALDRRSFFATLADMHQGRIDILIGTQMIAKGHDFPGVTLVGVLWADGGMSMPDFRAGERTFQLLTQVIGRAGRGETPGEVVIQTLRPEHYVIGYATRHDYQGFFAHEAKLRRYPRFPPLVRMMVVRIRGRVEREVQEGCGRLAGFCRQQATAAKLGVEILGPAPAPLDKIRDHYRWQVLLKAGDSESLKALGSAIRKERKSFFSGSCEISFDVDPENMM